MKTFFLITCLLMLGLIQHAAYAQQPLAQQAFTIFEEHCLDCHGEFGSYTDALLIKRANLIVDRAVVRKQPDASELYLRLLGDTDTGPQMPLEQDPLDAKEITTIRRWIEAGAPDWEAIPKPKHRFITTEAMLQTIHTHVTSLAAFDRSFARYFTLTHLYNAGASDANLRAYRNALSKLVNSLSWGSKVVKPTPIDPEETIFYIDLRYYEWNIKSDKWYKIEQAYPYGVPLKSSTYTTVCQETDCELPFVRADWFIATASLPPLYYEILDLPETVKELETQLEVDVSKSVKNAPGVRVWRAGFNESGVSVNNRIVERHKSQYGAYWKSYDFAGNVGTQNIFTHPLNFTHDGSEIIFNLLNGLQAYYLSTATGERLDEAPINIVSNAGAKDRVIRNGLSCMVCHTEGMKTFEDQVRSVVEQNRNPSYDKAQALRLYVEKSEMDSLVRQDIARYRQAIEAAGGVFGGSEPIQQLVKQFEEPLDATRAAAEVGLETADFLKKIHGNRTLRKAGLLGLMVKRVINPDPWQPLYGTMELQYGTVKRDAWESKFREIVAALQGQVISDKLGITKPTYKFRVDPKYPDTAKEAKKEGTVILQLTIDENGIPKNIVALTSLGFGLEEAAIEATKKMTFNPATKGGTPISLENVRISYEFKLDSTPSGTANTDMVLIPAGEFQMGSNDSEASDDEKPVHTVYVDAFYIDKYEVTVGAYKEFIQATGYPDPDWHEIAEDSPTDRHPIVRVSWHDAMAYAQWAGKRLPTEAEWEKAARGGLVGQKYTWGNAIDPSKGNYNRNAGGTTVVGSYPPNGYGLYDMAGNAWEWCLDEYDSDFYTNSPQKNPISGGTIEDIISNVTVVKTDRVLRGIAWTDTAEPVLVATRVGGNPAKTSRLYGFRCVKPVTP